MTLTGTTTDVETTTDVDTTSTSRASDPTTTDRRGGNGTAPAPPTGERPSRAHRSLSAWVLIVLAITVLAVLVVRLVNDDASPEPDPPATFSDPKDRPGYRSPTIGRGLTSGDAKDRPGYRSPTIGRGLTSGDAKDRPGYRSPTGER